MHLSHSDGLGDEGGPLAALHRPAIAAPHRVERRKAQTRQKLAIAAARAMLADDTAAQASIQEITETADVGFGSCAASPPITFCAITAAKNIGIVMDQPEGHPLSSR